MSASNNIAILYSFSVVSRQMICLNSLYFYLLRAQTFSCTKKLPLPCTEIRTVIVTDITHLILGKILKIYKLRLFLQFGKPMQLKVNMFRKVSLVICLVSCITSASAQDDDYKFDDLYEDYDTSLVVNVLFQRLSFYYSTPTLMLKNYNKFCEYCDKETVFVKVRVTSNYCIYFLKFW